MKSSTATPYPQRIGEGYDIFKAYLKMMPILLIFCAGLSLPHVVQAQTRYTHDFSTPATLSGREENGYYNTKATIDIGGVEYELSGIINGNWENRSNGGANNSASLYFNTAATTSFTIRRKDNQKFRFYSLWLTYTCSSDGLYLPPHLRVAYNETTLPQEEYQERNRQGLVVSNDVEVRTVTFMFSGLLELNIDNLVVGPAGTPLSSIANLSNLTLSGTALSPDFNVNTVNYSASVANAVASVSVTPTKADANATVSVNGTVLTSGVTSRTVNLNVGANTITVVVTAQNGSTKTYTVTVTRAAAPSTPPVAGYVNALQFDGVNDYVEIPSQPSNQFNSETEFTVSLWFKANSMNRAGLFSRPSGGGGDMQFWLTAENGIFIYGIDKHGYGWTWLSTPTAYKLGEWVQVTTVRRNVNGERRMEIYANGVLVGSDRVNFTSSASNASIRIGTVINADGGFANGQIDNVSLWKKALTAEEIKTLGATTLNGNEAGLAGYWRFDETSGTIAYDATANANHGTLRNMDLAAARVASTAGDIITKKNVAYAGKLTGSDPEGKPLSYILVTRPSKGMLILNNKTGAFEYTPYNNAVGADNFSYRVSNGTTDSNTATVNVTIVELAAPSVPDLSSASDTGLSNNDNITNDNTPTFSGTATAGYTVTLYSGGSVVGTATADGAGNWSITTTTLADGAYTMTAKAEDGTGSQSPASAALTVVIDTTAPNTTITSNPSTLTNSTSGIFSFTSTETGSSFQASVEGSPFTFATSPLTLTGLSEGTHTLEVRAVDVAGNVDPTPASYTWTVDLTAPVVTNITRYNPATETTNASAVTYLVSFSKSVTGVSTEDFTLTGTGTATGTIAGVSGSGERYEVTVSGISGSGTLRLDMKASGTGIMDMVGNGLSGGYSSGQTYTIETTPPAITSVSVPANATYRADQNLDFTINFDEAVVVDTQNGTPILGLTIGAASQEAVYMSGSGSTALSFRYTVLPGDLDRDGIALGTIALNGGTITDAIGNEAVLTLNGVASTAGVLVDAVAPALQTVTIASSNSDATKAKVGDVVTLRVEASESIAQPAVMIAGRLATVTAISTTTYTASYTLTAADAEGTVPFTITYQDMAGNAGTAVSATTNNSSVTFDKTAPSGTLAINNGASYTASTAVALSISATDALTGVAAMRFSNDNTTWSGWEPFAVSKSWTLPAGNGTQQVYAQLRDGAGNIGLAQAQITVDNVPLTLTLTSNVGPATNTPFEVLFTFSKAATGFTLADLNVLNATASNLMTADNQVYRATITPTAEGEVKVSVAAGVAVDAAGNGNAASNTLTTRYDNTRPVVTLASEAASLVRGPFDVTFSFSEQVTGFTIADIAVVNGSADGLVQTGDKVYTARITPDQEGEVVVALVADAVKDAAGNDNLASQELKRTYDSVKPTLLLATTATNPTNAPFDVTFTFSEEISGFALEDISVANGTVSNLAATDGKSYGARITPSASGEVSISVAAEKAQDAAGNFNAASNILKINYDAEKPTLVLATAAPNPTNSSFEVSVTFSENVSGFSLQGITVTNATLSALATSDNQTYTVQVTPAANGLVTLSIPAGIVQDAAGNTNLASTQLTRNYDATWPQITVATTASSPVNSAFTAQFTFTEEVTSFELSDIAVTNGAVSDFVKVNATTYTALVTPAANGEVTVAVTAGKATDAAGNENLASNVLKMRFDTDKPTLLLASTSPAAVNASFSVHFTFSKDVTGFAIGDIVVTNGSAADFAAVDARTYTVRVMPAAEGEVRVAVAADAALDGAGNGSAASNTLTRQYDTSKPAVVVSTSASDPINSAFSVTFEFSEEVTGFAATGIAITNGTLLQFSQVDGRRYSALVTPAAAGEVSVQVPANVASDAASNGNLASNTLSLVYDAERPAVVLATTAPDPTNSAFQVSVTFSESVAGFTAQSITVTNATLSDVTTTDNQHYTFEVAPLADGLVSLSVPDGVVADAAGNRNTASQTLTRTFSATRPTLVLSTNATSPTNAAFEVTFSFSKEVSGFELGDIDVSNGAAAGFTHVSAQVYTARITLDAAGEVIIVVKENVAHDRAGNGNAAAVALKLSIDKTQPTVVLTSSAREKLNAAFKVSAVFSEAVTGFAASDVTVVNGTVTGFAAEGDRGYILEITPQADGEVRVSLAAGVAQDAAGNLSLASKHLIRFYDNTRPAAEVTTTVASPVNAAFAVRFTFSEMVEFFEVANITVENGNVSNLIKESATVFTALVTPSANGMVTVAVAENQTQDAYGNGNLPSNRLQVSYDVSQPTLVLSATAADVVKTPFEVTFTFSKEVTGFAIEDITVTNGSASALKTVSQAVYTALVTPLADGEVSIAVAADVARDAAGNGNQAAGALTRIYDATSPTLVLSTGSTNPTNAAFEVVFTFSEPISGFTLEDILAEGGIVSDLVPSITGKVYTATITPSVEGEVAVSVAEDVVKDGAGNGNLASHVLRMQYDKTRPTVILATTAPSLTNAAIPLTIEFSEPVTGFDLADITITNATSSDLTKVSETKYSALVVPARDGEVSITIAENKVADAATNGNKASNRLTLTYDGTAPVGYAIAWSATRVDVSNLEAVILSVTGAEPGTAYTYHITSGQESTAVSGTGEVTEESFRINNLDLEKLKDGQLTVRLYLTDKAGNKGAEVTAQVLKITRNIASVTAAEMIQVPIRTTFEQVPLPATVGVTYSTGEAAQVKVRWEVGNYDGTKAGQYVLTGTLELAEMTTNLGNLTAKATVEVQTNKAPTALAFSATTFKPETTADEVIGSLSTTDPDDTEFVYTLASGEGDTHNALFEIRSDQVYLKSNKGLSGMTTFTIRVRSTDPYLNTIERTFTLTKQAYDRTVDQFKIVNAFSPNGDGINDNWTIPELRFYNEVHIQVFDRSGVRVFETRDPETGWNGRSTGGQVLKGPFLYIVEVKDINWVKRGVVTILSK